MNWCLRRDSTLDCSVILHIRLCLRKTQVSDLQSLLRQPGGAQALGRALPGGSQARMPGGGSPPAASAAPFLPHPAQLAQHRPRTAAMQHGPPTSVADGSLPWGRGDGCMVPLGHFAGASPSHFRCRASCLLIPCTTAAHAQLDIRHASREGVHFQDGGWPVLSRFFLMLFSGKASVANARFRRIGPQPPRHADRRPQQGFLPVADVSGGGASASQRALAHFVAEQQRARLPLDLEDPHFLANQVRCLHNTPSRKILQKLRPPAD